MMFPSAVQGHMPYVDQYKKQQIKKVIERARSRHHSGPEKVSTERQAAKQKNTHSMPILWQSVYAGQKPRFISMPNSLNTHNHHLRSLQQATDTLPTSRSKASSGNSFISSIKKLFRSRKNESNVRDNLSGAIIESNSARPFTAPPTKKSADNDSHINESPKRQRMRTISNISSVMETIEEVNEIMASRDEIHDSSSSSSNSLDCDSIASAPELGAGTLYYNSFSDISNTSSTSSHLGSTEILCAA